MPDFSAAAVVPVIGLHRLSKNAVKASRTLCGAAGSGLVTAYNGAVLKMRWAWLLWAYLVMLSSVVAVLLHPKDAAANLPSES